MSFQTYVEYMAKRGYKCTDHQQAQLLHEQMDGLISQLTEGSQSLKYSQVMDLSARIADCRTLLVSCFKLDFPGR